MEAVRNILAWVFRPVTERRRGTLGLVLWCFTLAFIIWLLNSLSRKVATEVTVPIKLNYNEKYYIPLHPAKQNAKARVEGRGWQMLHFYSLEDPDTLLITLQNPSMGSKLDTSALRKHLVTKYENVEITNVVVEHMHIPFDRKSQKWVQVKLRNKDLQNYREGNFTFYPKRVLISGAKSYLDKLSDTLHLDIPTKKRNEDFEHTVEIDHLKNNPLVKCSHEVVMVKFAAKKKSYQ